VAPLLCGLHRKLLKADVLTPLLLCPSTSPGAVGWVHTTYPGMCCAQAHPHAPALNGCEEGGLVACGPHARVLAAFTCYYYSCTYAACRRHLLKMRHAREGPLFPACRAWCCLPMPLALSSSRSSPIPVWPPHLTGMVTCHIHILKLCSTQMMAPVSPALPTGAYFAEQGVAYINVCGMTVRGRRDVSAASRGRGARGGAWQGWQGASTPRVLVWKPTCICSSCLPRLYPCCWMRQAIHKLQLISQLRSSNNQHSQPQRR